jgi:hypothetical protein
MLLWFLVAMVVTATSNPFGAQYDPSHDHIVLGGNALERARALAWHIRNGHGQVQAARTAAKAHVGDENDDVKVGRVRMLFIHSDATGVTVLGSTSGALLTALWSLIVPTSSGERAAVLFTDSASESEVLVPQPPPRAT